MLPDGKFPGIIDTWAPAEVAVNVAGEPAHTNVGEELAVTTGLEYTLIVIDLVAFAPQILVPVTV